MFWNFSASLSHKTTATLRQQSGFGLVELMVSISIMVLVSAIMLTHQSSFNGAVLLRSQAYEVALQLREIQLSAVSASSNGSGDYRSVLGVHFDSASANNDQYVIFKDTPASIDPAKANGFYDPGEEFGLQGILDKRFEIQAIRVDGVPVAYPVSVVFVRPNFDARFFKSGAELYVPNIEIDIARRGVSGLGVGVLRTVEVTSSGQIAVQ